MYCYGILSAGWVVWVFYQGVAYRYGGGLERDGFLPGVSTCTGVRIFYITAMPWLTVLCPYLHQRWHCHCDLGRCPSFFEGAR